MEIIFSPSAINDLAYWKNVNNPKMLDRITSLLQSIQDDPFHGIGKPEPLKHHLSGAWSRRINKEHRILYTITAGAITVHSLREHY